MSCWLTSGSFFVCRAAKASVKIRVLFVAFKLRLSETVRQIIKTAEAPQAIGPYSQAIVAGGFVFTSGQIPLDPQTGEFVEGGIVEQTEQVLRNLSKVLEAAGTGLSRVVKTTVYLADMNDFAAMNEVYGRFFELEPPARSTVQAARLPRDARVEIDVVALAGGD
ncbi:MAG: RidA family protein [Acidobacteria bacterium]|nr:RidA family protein [Acidobacteriota bacterium]